MKVIILGTEYSFALESGLNECSEWARCEEMVDWVARQGPKIWRVWEEAGAV